MKMKSHERGIRVPEIELPPVYKLDKAVGFNYDKSSSSLSISKMSADLQVYPGDMLCLHIGDKILFGKVVEQFGQDKDIHMQDIRIQLLDVFQPPLGTKQNKPSTQNLQFVLGDEQQSKFIHKLNKRIDGQEQMLQISVGLSKKEAKNKEKKTKEAMPPEEGESFIDKNWDGKMNESEAYFIIQKLNSEIDTQGGLPLYKASDFMRDAVVTDAKYIKLLQKDIETIVITGVDIKLLQSHNSHPFYIMDIKKTRAGEENYGLRYDGVNEQANVEILQETLTQARIELLDQRKLRRYASLDDVSKPFHDEKIEYRAFAFDIKEGIEVIRGSITMVTRGDNLDRIFMNKERYIRYGYKDFKTCNLVIQLIRPAM
jgi:hypothetical protein